MGVDVYRRIFRVTLFKGMCALGVAWAQPPVAVHELLPAELPGYLQQHPKVFVLLTSTDPKCASCTGADAAFEQAVQKVAHPDWRYVQVRWEPWRAFPPEVQALKVSDIPSHVAVVQGRVMGKAQGETTDIDVLSQRILAAKRGGTRFAPSFPPEPPARAQVSPSARSYTPVNLENWLRPMQPGWAEVQGRRTYMLALRQGCISRHPQTEQVLRLALNQWGRQALQIVMDPSQVGWLEKEEGKRAVAEQEAQFAQSLQTQTGLSHLSELAAEDCERLMNAAASVPLPVVPPAPARVR